MLSRALSTTALLLAAAPALAGGFAPVVAPVAPATPVAVAPAAPASDWTGFYVGGQFGFGRPSQEFEGVLIPNFDAEENGALYGVHAGYMHDFGRLVLGAEIDHDRSDFATTAQGVEFYSLDSITRAKLRLGFDAGRVLPYVTAGIAHADFGSGEYEVEGGQGRFVGLGLAFRATDRLTVGVEALRHEFDGVPFEEADTSLDTVTVRASWRF